MSNVDAKTETDAHTATDTDKRVWIVSSPSMSVVPRRDTQVPASRYDFTDLGRLGAVLSDRIAGAGDKLIISLPDRLTAYDFHEDADNSADGEDRTIMADASFTRDICTLIELCKGTKRDDGTAATLILAESGLVVTTKNTVKAAIDQIKDEEGAFDPQVLFQSLCKDQVKEEDGSGSAGTMTAEPVE